MEKTFESLLDHKEFKTVSLIKEINLEHSFWKDWCWSWSCNILATWCKELTQWKRAWGCKMLKAEEEVGGRGWGDWIVSPTQWTWTWGNWEMVKDREAWHIAVHEVMKNQTQLGNQTTTKSLHTLLLFFISSCAPSWSLRLSFCHYYIINMKYQCDIDINNIIYVMMIRVWKYSCICWRESVS